MPSPSISTPSGPITERLDHSYQQQQQQKVPDMQREIKISKRTVKAQDKLILDLKKQLEIQAKSIQDTISQSRSQSDKLEQLEFELANVKRMNQSLMEENEGYQLLLHEKTLSGEFIQDPILQVDKEPGEGFNLALELNKVIQEDGNQDGTHKVKGKKKKGITYIYLTFSSSRDSFI
jgi:predicted RNase H-like nuclease (RuvC/YqgF family)